jgi:ABC-type multidrug transport system fused ATPase/permease subunit
MKYFNFILSLNKKTFSVFVVFFLLFSTFCEYLFVWVIPVLLNIVFNNNALPNYLNFFYELNEKSLIQYILLCIVFLFIIKNVVFFFNQLFFFKYSFFINNKISNSLLSNYLYRNYSFFLKSKNSELFRNIKDNANAVGGLVQNDLILFSEILVFVGITIIIIIHSSLISILVIIFLISFSIGYLYFSKHLSKTWSLRRQEYESAKIETLQESFDGFKELKILNKEYVFIKNYNENNTKSNLMTLRFNLLYIFPRIYLEIVGALGVLFLIIFNLGSTDKNVFLNAIPLLSLYFIAFIRLLPSMNRILNSIETHRFSFLALKIIYKELKNDLGKNYMNNNYNKPIINFNNKIILQKVSFFYKKKVIFNNIDLQINYGDKIGIIGENGIGKTTLLNLLSGLLEPTKGNIICDGKDINKNIKSWRKNVSYIYQSTFLMNDTIENNISFYSDKKNELHNRKISEVLKKTNLRSFLTKLPEGLDTIVGEKGSRLSGGQIQKIGIARALYFERKILICDEITSSLDRNAEDSVINCLKNIDKTVIIISHKIDNLRFCSKIYKIHDGKITLVKTR